MGKWGNVTENSNWSGAVYMAFSVIYMEVARLSPLIMIVALLSCSRDMLHWMAIYAPTATARGSSVARP